MKTILLLSLLALAQTASAAPFPYPTVIAPRPTVPDVTAPAVIQSPSLTPSLQVYPTPALVLPVRPAASYAAPSAR